MDDSVEAAAQVSAIPRATARLQFHAGFTFDDARALLPYLQRLGISHVFASPILAARAGSTHGYDVVDHGRVSDDIGGEHGLRRLVSALRDRGMGLIVDVVPNHMAVGADNARWVDVLEWGRDSPDARFFDIDWDVPDPGLRHRLLAPFLAAPYGELLAQGNIALCYEHGRLCIAVGPQRFPLAPQLYGPLLRSAGPALASVSTGFAAVSRGSRAARRRAFETACAALRQATSDATVADALSAVLRRHAATTADGAARLHGLLERQHYRLAWWRTAADEINWRRFFDITDLAALRVEDAAVFEAVHATTFRLYAEGLIDGLRIDHVDGLADPRGYCRRLRLRLASLARTRPDTAPKAPAYIVVEKILGSDERLPKDWLVDGSSGYSFMNEVGALLHDASGEAALGALWAGLGGRPFPDEQRLARRRITEELFSADFNACALALHRIARAEVATRDWTLAAIRRVLAEILVQFPVYRTYADASGRSAADAELMSGVVEGARRGCRPGERPLVDLIDRWLGGEPPGRQKRAAARSARLRAIARFQQLSAPIAAKAVEDTAFYRHGRLLSRNEVGADPARLAADADDFHAACAQRRQRYPRALLATATHDHKRGEDLRARLAVLSEVPQRWAQTAQAWSQLNAAQRTAVDNEPAPDARDEYMLYQMLVGSWPPELRLDDAVALETYAARLGEWQRKAVREAKRHSGWIEPNLAYEEASAAFLSGLLDSHRSGRFLQSLQAFVDSVAAAGAVKSLTQTLLRVTAPGVPDLYQGTDLWDFSLVDPDNRRPVDFVTRAAALECTHADEWLLRSWRDGMVKQRLIQRTLALRAAHPDLFEHGSYQPLAVGGPQAGHFVAFARCHRGQAAVVVAPRLVSALLEQPDSLRLAPASLAGLWVELPVATASARWVSCLEDGGRALRVDRRIELSAMLDRWPLALLRSA